jgi:hypothetical protein
MTNQKRLENYRQKTGFPLDTMVGESGRIVGIWEMGADYRVASGYYGGYPAGYLRRVRALFPDKQRPLHLFSGRVDTEAFPGDTVDLNPVLQPTYVANAETLEGVPVGHYDLVLADPPYSVEDSEHYGLPMVSRNKVIDALSRILPAGAHVAWLDQVLPMYRKADWEKVGSVGMVKSTNHRFRVLTIFERK